MARRRGCLVAIGAVGLGLLALGAWARTLFWWPDDVEPVAVHCADDAPALTPGQRLKVLVWNVQYAGSRRHHFFYDGGDAVHVPEADVAATLDRIAEVVERESPDLVLLQEVDRDSARTGRLDQHAALLARTPFACHASTPYHRVGFVPIPSHRPLGRVDMHLSVFSRYRLTDASRVALPLLDEPWWRQLFNLRRGVLDVSVPVAGGGALRLLNTHLSAFSKGDGTLDRQVAVLDRLATTSEVAGAPWLLGGDLNALPPSDVATRLPDGLEQYPEPVTPVQRLFRRFASVVPAPQYAADPQRWRTYLPFGADAPDRTLDYVFVGRSVTVDDVRVLQETDVSDHLPLVVELTLP